MDLSRGLGDVYKRQLQNELLKMNFENKNLLMMSSGNFDGIDFKELGEKVVL
jgi:UDP-N-acetylmuramate: L-alanyl-gamma-D-glutamyl-meso-diaminopimelate ligase